MRLSNTVSLLTLFKLTINHTTRKPHLLVLYADVQLKQKRMQMEDRLASVGLTLADVKNYLVKYEEE
jgi:hypothetical protein